MTKNITIRVFYTLLAGWFVAYLIFVGQLTAIYHFGTTQLLACLLILISSPALSVLWLWLMDRPPWNNEFLVAVILAGAIFAAILSEHRGEYLWLIPIIWSAVAIISARIFRLVSRFSSLNWKQAVTTSAPTPIVIDHGKYLRLLDDQAVGGFPSIMRVCAYFVERLPVAISALKDNGPVLNHEELSNQLSGMHKFLLGQLSCKLAFLCGMAFFERMCGPDFRYTRQYQLLIDHLTGLNAISVDAWQGQFKEFTHKAITAAELSAIVEIIDNQKVRDKAKNREGGADNVTITICSLKVLLSAGLIDSSENVSSNSDFIRMTLGGMTQMRETFTRQVTRL